MILLTHRSNLSGSCGQIYQKANSKFQSAVRSRLISFIQLLFAFILSLLFSFCPGLSVIKMYGYRSIIGSMALRSWRPRRSGGCAQEDARRILLYYTFEREVILPSHLYLYLLSLCNKDNVKCNHMKIVPCIYQDSKPSMYNAK